MSIIYDALKKVERSNPVETKTKIDKDVKSKPRIYLLYALLVCLVIFIVNIFYGWLSSAVMKDLALTEPSNKSSILQAESASEDIYKTPKKTAPAFTLNGVFFSGAEGYALINNRIVKKGDKIEGATVVKIYLDEVDLDWDGSIIKLSISTR